MKLLLWLDLVLKVGAFLLNMFCLGARSPHLILRRARFAFFHEVVQDFRQWRKSNNFTKPIVFVLGARGLQSYDDSSGAGFLPSTVRNWSVKPQTEACDVGGEANERKVANKHCTVTSVLYSVWGTQPDAAPVFGGRSSKRPVNAQSTLQSTLPKCGRPIISAMGLPFE